jgi:hypothetical protein
VPNPISGVTRVAVKVKEKRDLGLAWPLLSGELRWRQMALRAVVLAVAAHSIGLGLSLLFFPVWALRLVGWHYAGAVFWPSQAGLFLVILGAAYAWAVRLRPLVWLVIGSKACAVLFLGASIAWLGVPRIAALLGSADGLMGLAVALLYWGVIRAESTTTR